MDKVGNTRNQARNVSLSSGGKYKFSDAIGGRDSNDYYRLRLRRSSDLNVSLTRLGANANLELLTSSGRVLQRSAKSGTRSESIRKTLDPGTYYLRVYPGSRKETKYAFGLSVSPKSLTVNSPNGGNTLSTGSTYTVAWADNISESVKIELYKGSSKVNTIAASEPSNGSFSWTVPSNLASGSDYRIKISSITNTNLYDWSNSYFTINPAVTDLEAAYFNIVEGSLEKGSAFTIDYQVRNNQPGNVSNFDVGFYLSTDSNLSTSDYFLGYRTLSFLAGNSSTTTLQQTLTLPEASNPFWSRTGTFYIGMVVDDISTIAETNENNNASTGLFKDYDDVAITEPVIPQIVVGNPNGGNALTTGSSYSINWIDDISENVSIDLYRGNVFDRTITSSTASDGSFTWSIPANLPGRSDYRLKITSLTNNQIYDYSNAEFAIQPSIATTNWTAQFFNRTSNNYNLNDWAVSGSTFRATLADVTLDWGSQGSTGNIKARLYRYLDADSPAVGIDSDYFAGWMSTRMYLESGKQYRILTDSDDGTAFYLKPINSTSISYLGADWQDRSTYEPTTTIPFTVSQTGYYDFGLKYFEGIGGSVLDVTVEELVTPVNRPDLVIQGTTVPSHVTNGSLVTVTASTINIGTLRAGIEGNEGESYTRYWLSNDTTLDASDISLGMENVGSLAPGESQSDTFSFTYNASWGTGTKYILFEADHYREINESNETNNVVYRAINVSAAPVLFLSFPNGGNALNTGSSYTIGWNDNLSESIKLELYKGNSLVHTIDSSDPSDGAFSWAVPMSLVGGSDYRIKIASTTNSGLYDWSDNYFTIRDWFDQNISDAGVKTTARSLFFDNSLSRNDMLNIFQNAEDAGNVSSDELVDLRTLVSNTNYISMPDHVRVLSNKVVNSNPANARYKGSTLGNLYANSSSIHLDKLVDKWFLGGDRPETNYTYAYAGGSLFQNGITYGDINQGSLGNCYFVAALAETAFRSPTTIQQMFIDNGDGTYTVRFFKPTNSSHDTYVADYVTVDRYLPVNGNRLVYASRDLVSNYTSSSNELWVALAEKAYAQLNEEGWLQGNGTDDSGVNAYSSIGGGYSGLAVEDIAGRNAQYDSLDTSDFTILVNAYNSGKLVTFSDSGHAYALVGYNASTQKFKIFNPWGLSFNAEYTIAELVNANFRSFYVSTT